MTQTVAEMFMLQLSRAGARPADRFLRKRGLQPADRDDVIAAATLWCWEHQHEYSLTTTLETWFMNAVRNAYQDLKRDELPPAAESLEQIGGPDETYNAAAAESSARALVDSLTQSEATVATLTMRGYTRAEMIEKGIPQHVIDGARKRIKQLRGLITDVEATRMITRSVLGSSDDADDRLSHIDRELERLDFAPAHGKDCPPCWRCLWFEGFLPLGKRETRMEVADIEVREAVGHTETRKIHIAQQVRAAT